MKNRKQYELIEIDGEFKAAVIGSDPLQICYLIESPKTKEAALDEIRRMNAIYYLSDYAPEEIAEFWQSIDMAPVNDFFSQLLGLPINLEKRISGSGGSVSFLIRDNTNIAPLNAVTAAAWSEMFVCSFGGGISADKTTGALFYWASINLSYKHHGGGSNGAEIGRVQYKHSAWDIKSAEGGQR